MPVSRCLASLQPSRLVADEIHRWGSNRDLWEILDKGTAIRQQPLAIAITTAGIFGESELCWEFHETARQVDQKIISLPTFYGRVFTTPTNWDWTDPGEPAKYDRWGDLISRGSGWYAANPALGDFLPIEKLLEECKEARNTLLKSRASRDSDLTSGYRVNPDGSTSNPGISVTEMWTRSP